jgi:hypothetical protein
VAGLIGAVPFQTDARACVAFEIMPAAERPGAAMAGGMGVVKASRLDQ